MLKKSEEIMDFLDDYILEQAQKITPKVTRDIVSANLKVYHVGDDISSVFYRNVYLMTIKWDLIY